jgi:hypothetical protein
MTNIRDEVRAHVLTALLPPDTTLPSGADEIEITAFSERTGMYVPNELWEWLSSFNGPLVGPQGILGIRPDEPFLDIESWLAQTPWWIEKGWIPIAGDGCGNFFVMDSKNQVGGTHPVYFIDCGVSRHIPDYIVASGLWPFLRFLLIHDRIADEEERYWPHDRNRVLSEDPQLREYQGSVPFLWDLE